ncbi:MAG: hypothetical protein Tp132SUR00d2C45923861_11 [Prokaryotic dsDNA virus sp.]|nr:MAG: hypothetical protein Tp132SUR00d2C45923861_11 [Prokaryotic dsDNA virus sp.]|tara:strand:- start:11982 stop:12839 length:858 start_codon:yes stop_codon:yes gene_type:complete
MAVDYSKVSSGMVNPGAAVGTALSTLASALPTKSEQIQMSMMKTIENELTEPMKLLGKDPSTYTDLDEPVRDAFSLYTDWKDSLSPSEKEIAMRNNINAMTFGNAYQKSAISVGTAISKKIQDFGNEDIYAKIGMSKNLAPFLKSVDPLAMDYLVTPKTKKEKIRSGAMISGGIGATATLLGGAIKKYGVSGLIKKVTSKVGASLVLRTIATLTGGALAGGVTGGALTAAMLAWSANDIMKIMEAITDIEKEEGALDNQSMPSEEQPTMTKSREDILKSLYELKK